LEPVLGTVERDGRQLVLADIPGLIEGASGGAGLGHEFLAHVERTRLLVHVLELAPLDGSDPARNFETIESELQAHDPRLARLPRVLALSKADLVTAEDGERAREAWAGRLGEDVPVLLTSSATGQGLDALVDAVFVRVPPEEPAEAVASAAGAGGGVGSGEPDADELAEHVTFRPAADRGFQVQRGDDGTFRVVGRGVERLLARYDLENDEAMAHVEGTLHRIGVIRALEDAGFQPGDDVEIAGVVFELDPE
jgi:GTPase